MHLIINCVFVLCVTELKLAVLCAVDKHFTRRVFCACYVVWHPSAQLFGVACEHEHQGDGGVHVAVQYSLLVYWHGRLLLFHSKVRDCSCIQIHLRDLLVLFAVY